MQKLSKDKTQESEKQIWILTCSLNNKVNRGRRTFKTRNKFYLEVKKHLISNSSLEARDRLISQKLK